MERLDAFLVKKGLVTSRERAKEMILKGQVTVNGKSIMKPSFDVKEIDDVKVVGELLPYVSRGGLKLEGAIKAFDIKLTDKVCMDVGASTGGFTDCMLQNGAAKVWAIDVGTNQLAEKLRKDSKVISLEQTNIRTINPSQVDNIHFDFISCDVSFVSLIHVLPVIYGFLKEGGESVCLIKPQFEAGKAALNKKGVVKDKKIHEKVVRDISEFAKNLGFTILGGCESPITGPEGNIEFLIYLKR